MQLCKPASSILVISIAGALYHCVVGRVNTMFWWILIGIFGTGIFQGLCINGIEPIAWIVMMIPILIVCFFFAIALFTSSVRINNGDCPRECEHEHEQNNCPGSCNVC